MPGRSHGPAYQLLVKISYSEREVANRSKREILKTFAGWTWREFIKPKLPEILAVLAPIAVALIGKGKSFFLTSHPTPGWVIIGLLIGTLITLVWIGRWVTASRPGPRWYSWNGADWQFTPEFFAKSYELRPDQETDIGRYVRGPFCRNTGCRREMSVIDVGGAGPFSVVHVKCGCRVIVEFDFHQEVVGMTPIRAILLRAVLEGQAAVRRGERFRESQ